MSQAWGRGGTWSRLLFQAATCVRATPAPWDCALLSGIQWTQKCTLPDKKLRGKESKGVRRRISVEVELINIK